jgi:hypothetical protein
MLNRNPKQIDNELLGDIANLRHVRNLLKTCLTVIDYLKLFNSESVKELKQDVEKAMMVCNNELGRYEKHQ